MNTLAERIEFLLREHPDVTQKAVADACDIKPSSVSDWISGKTKHMRADVMLKCARFFKVYPDWLAMGEGPIFIDQNIVQIHTNSEAKKDIFEAVHSADEKNITLNSVEVIKEILGTSPQNVAKIESYACFVNSERAEYVVDTETDKAGNVK